MCSSDLRSAGDTHPAMKTHQQARGRQFLHIAAYRLQGDAQTLGQLLHGGRLLVAYFFQQLQLAGVVIADHDSRENEKVIDRKTENKTMEIEKK